MSDDTNFVPRLDGTGSLGRTDKRWNEVRKRIPRTVGQADDSVYEAFLFYAVRYWPEGYLRHILDAIQFANFLKANQIGRPDKRELRALQRILSS